jgi:thermitase
MRILVNKFLRTVPFALILLTLGWGPPDSGQKKTEKRNRPVFGRADRLLRVETSRRPAGPRYAPDRVLVRFRSGVTPEQAEGILSSYQAGRIRRIPGIDVYCVTIPPFLTVGQALSLLGQRPEVEYTGPDYRTRIFATPNDTYFLSYQVNLYNPGKTLDISPDLRPQTKSGADIKARAAWDETKGDPELVVAFMDTGVDLGHPDLKDKIVSPGRDFVNGDMDAVDDNSHGTFVAGVAAAETDNNEGIAGVAWNCRILPVKVTDAQGNGYYDALIEGIIWAADNGAKVINISLGGDADDPALESACRYAFDKKVVIVAAAGNDGASVAYPAAYDDYVIAVAATDYNDDWASFSNPGPQVDVAAPGVYILGPVPQWYAGPNYLPYAFGSGTSAAAPEVAGLAALLMSDKPWLTVKQVMDIIKYTADDVNKASLPGRDDRIGYGRINMERALVPYQLGSSRTTQ